MLITLSSWDVGGAPGKQCPARRRSSQVAAPDLHDAGLARNDQKRRRQRLNRIGCELLKQLSKPGKLSPPQRVPVPGAFVSPRYLNAVPYQREIQWRIYIPTERRGRCEGFAIPISPGREHTIRGAIGRPRQRSVGDESVKPADNRLSLVTHLRPSGSRRDRRLF